MLQCIVLIRCSTARDPRFDTNIGPGAFNKDKFRKQYAFLYDDVLPQEKATLKEQLKVRQAYLHVVFTAAAAPTVSLHRTSGPQYTSCMQ